MKYIIYEEKLRKLGLFSLEKRMLGVVVCICVVLFNVFKYLERSCKQDRARLFSVVPTAKTRGNGHILEHRKFLLNIRRHFIVRVPKHLHRLPREVVETSPVEVFKRHLVMVLGHLL